MRIHRPALATTAGTGDFLSFLFYLKRCYKKLSHSVIAMLYYRLNNRIKQIACLLLFVAPVIATSGDYEVIDSSYTVCSTKQQYRQLLSFSLYGVGKPPATGCFAAPEGAKAIILQCPDSDIILCQFRLEPDATEAIDVWASKVMLRETQ